MMGVMVQAEPRGEMALDDHLTPDVVAVSFVFTMVVIAIMVAVMRWGKRS